MHSPSSDLMHTPCSCGGQNEKCFRCGGWGFIDSISAGRSTDGDTGPSTMAPWQAPKVTNRNDQQGQQEEMVGPLPRRRACPQCGRKYVGLEDHIRAVHSSKLQPHQLRPLYLPPPYDPEALVQCALCQKLLPQKRMSQHLAAAHPKLGIPALPQEKSRVVPSQTGRSNSEINELTGSERRLDATRDYYEAYRENGRFGSHPSHDGYDDESGPQ